MSLIPNDGRMKPIIIIPPDTMSDPDIKELRDNGLCVVVAKNPAAVNFLDPIPSAGDRTKTEEAAIELSRMILNKSWTPGGLLGHGEACQLFIQILLKGTRLDSKPNQRELEKEIFASAKADELRRLARVEAKEERDAAKAKKKESKNVSS